MARAGNFKDLVTIEKPRDDSGLVQADGHIDYTKDENWNDWIERRAEVLPTSGREFVAGQKVMAETTWMVRTYYDEDTAQINSRMKLTIKRTGCILQIVAAYENANNRREYIIQCKEPM